MLKFWRGQRDDARPNRGQHTRVYAGFGTLLSAGFARVIAFALLGLGSETSTHAAPNDATWPQVRLQLVATGFTNPIDLVDPRDGTDRLFVVERNGTIRIIEEGVVLETEFFSMTTNAADCSECGLLGLAFPPNFAEAGYFFINYTSVTDVAEADTGDPDTTGDTVIARVRVSANPNVADAASEEAILEINQPDDNHNGGHIRFGPDGYLYIGMGDGGGGGDRYDNAQNPASLHGKILRITVGATGTYTIPLDNPFIDAPGYRDEIWAEGLRNPWRFSFDATTGDFYVADVGQGDFEEVSHIPAAEIGNGGMNFGWPLVEGDVCYPPNDAQDCDRTGLTAPAATYNHDAGDCSVTGGYVYQSKLPFQLPVYLFADYCSGRVWGLQANVEDQPFELLEDFSFRITSFGEDRNGNVYLINYAGEIYQVVDLATLYYIPGLIKQE